PTTGSQDMVFTEMMIDGQGLIEKATMADVITFKTGFRVRPCDKLYIVVKA
ncbi:MAG: U32 family peptidase, partial [Ornithobacterium rhinotracheale]|nr:U32 family peptidase [Ornithobacterium rhinotracheale]